MCCVQYEVYSGRCTLGTVQCVMCSVQFAVCSMQCAVCSVQYAVQVNGAGAVGRPLCKYTGLRDGLHCTRMKLFCAVLFAASYAGMSPVHYNTI